MANGSAPLDEFQRSALDECAPPCRVSVLGAPGTGKTRLLEALVAREAAAPGGRIAVITFDRRARGRSTTRCPCGWGRCRSVWASTR